MKIARKYVYFDSREFDEFLKQHGLSIVIVAINIIRGNHDGYIIDSNGKFVGRYRMDHRNIYKISKKTYYKIIDRNSF